MITPPTPDAASSAPTVAIRLPQRCPSCGGTALISATTRYTRPRRSAPPAVARRYSCSACGATRAIVYEVAP